MINSRLELTADNKITISIEGMTRQDAESFIESLRLHDNFLAKYSPSNAQRSMLRQAHSHLIMQLNKI